MVKRILVPLDGSKRSESIVPYVEELLKGADGDVTLVGVTRTESPKEEQAARKRLEAVARRLREKGAYVDVAVLAGPPAPAIVNYAIQGHYDLIAMCTRGRTGLRRLILGSVAEEVLRRAPIPVFVAHPRAADAPAPKFRKMVVPMDGSHRSASILEPAGELARQHGSELAFVKVVPVTKSEDLPVEIVAKTLFQRQQALQKMGVKVELSLLFGDPALEILKFADANAADLIALSTHGRTGLDRLRYGSVAEQILRRSRIPLLVRRTAAFMREHPLHARGVGAARRALRLAETVGRGPRPPYSGG